MNKQTVIVGLASATVSAVATYFVMEMIHANEIVELLSEIDGKDGAPGPMGPMGIQGPPGECECRNLPEKEMHLVSGVKIQKEFVDEIRNMPIETKMAAESYGSDFPEDDDDVEDEEIEEFEGRYIVLDDAELEEIEANITADLDEIYVIPNDEVSGRQVIVIYNHETEMFDVAKTLSTDGVGLDDEINPIDFTALVGSEIIDMITSTEPGDEKRIVCVRNSVKNLDFVVGY